MSAVLVTGGLGVNGAWVTRNLVEQGVTVVTYSRHLDVTLIRDIVDKVECVVGDVLDLPKIIDTIKHYGVDRIIHMAGVLPDALEANPFMMYKINVDGTINILEAARLMDIKRVVYTSTGGVYDLARGEYAHPTYKPIDEDYPIASGNVYAATKLFGEHMCLNYNRIYGVDTIILRFSGIYGVGKQIRHGAAGLHSAIIESAMLGKPLKIPQGGDLLTDMVYTRDVANGICLACFVENPEHRIFNISTGKGEVLGKVVKILDEIYGKTQIDIGSGPSTTGISRLPYVVFSIDRARRELGYNSQYNLERGVKDYIATMKHLDIKPEIVEMFK